MLHQELGPHGWSQRPGAIIDKGLTPCRGKWAGTSSLEGSPGPKIPDQSGHCFLPQCPRPHTGTLAVQCPIDAPEGHAKTELQKNFGVMARPVGRQLRCTQTHRGCSVTGHFLEQALQEDWPGFSSFASYGPWPTDSTSGLFPHLQSGL